jgi:hypothetical protein
MTTWDRIRAALRHEKRDLDDAIDDATARGNATLDRKERELAATPEEKFALEQERMAQADADFEAARRRIEGDKGD